VIKQCISSDVFLEMAELFWLKIPQMIKRKSQTKIASTIKTEKNTWLITTSTKFVS